MKSVSIAVLLATASPLLQKRIASIKQLLAAKDISDGDNET